MAARDVTVQCEKWDSFVQNGKFVSVNMNPKIKYCQCCMNSDFSASVSVTLLSGYPSAHTYVGPSVRHNVSVRNIWREFLLNVPTLDFPV